MAGEGREGPVAEFCAGLRRMQQGAGLDRAMLARRLRFSRSQLYEILDGRIRRPPEWDRLVEPLVRVCTGDTRDPGNYCLLLEEAPARLNLVILPPLARWRQVSL